MKNVIGQTGDSGRLISLDALRGFDMFWIIGGDALFHALSRYTDWPVFNWMSKQLTHKYWEGFFFYDMIFPLFLFIAGVAIPLSISKRLEQGHSKRQIYKHALVRLFVLIILGLLLANRGIRNFDFENYRYTHVLVRIGIGWFFATIIFLNTKLRGQLLWVLGLLLSYWVLLQFIPVPGIGAGVLTPEGNFAGYIDRLLLPGSFYGGYFPDYMDPEGLLGHISGVAMGLIGALTGQILIIKKENLSGLKKGFIVGALGLLLIGLGLIWNTTLPIIKKIWTSSFVIYAAGWSMVFLAVFYLLIDVWNLRRWWSKFFIVIGSNAIFIYFCQSRVLDFRNMSNFFFEGLVKSFSNAELQKVIASLTYLVVSWLFLYFMYKKKIFIKV
ncbi:MAG: DUF5009 domain-containing protein [Bacteroidales bacterium]|nr:DUF5009 domain-containing protein [Bacteroidales bacterium]